jgi:hypothetical protein
VATRGFGKVKETYLPIKGYEKNYLISNKGNVFSTYKNRKLKLYDCGKGYWRVSLYLHKKVYRPRVHRLVASHFLRNPNFYEAINHIDGNKKNNHVDNLEWCDMKHNVNHALDTGLRKTGESVNLAKLTESQVFSILDMFAMQIPTKKIAEVFGVSKDAINHIRAGRTWSRITNIGKTARETIAKIEGEK